MIGRNLLSQNTVQPTRVSADGSPEYKTGGITIDWTTVAAVGSDTTLPDGGVVLSGQKYLRYGQVMTKITASGKFGPYDSAAADGRQLLARGDCVIIDETMTEFASGYSGFSARQDQVGNVFDGGEVYIDRVLNSGVGAASLAAGPTLANLLAAFPRLKITRN